MLGVIFTNLIEMMEQEVGLALTQQVLDEAELESDGHYTSVGFYPVQEVHQIVNTLSEHTKIPVPELVERFGRYLFPRLINYHPKIASGYNCLFDLLGKLDSEIHVEVLRLYPEAELPKFVQLRRNEQRLILLYQSFNGLESLAKGLILAGSEHFNEPVSVDIQPVRKGTSQITITKIAE